MVRGGGRRPAAAAAGWRLGEGGVLRLRLRSAMPPGRAVEALATCSEHNGGDEVSENRRKDRSSNKRNARCTRRVVEADGAGDRGGGRDRVRGEGEEAVDGAR